MGKTSCVVVVAISVVIMFAGQVFSSDDDGGDAGCPPLNPGSGSVHLVCEEGGQPANCKSPRVGTVARSVWKKDVIKQGKGVTSVVCRPDGTWKKSGGSSRAPAGYTKEGELGYIKFSLIALPYDLAEDVCKQDGARIMPIDSYEKMSFVEKIKVTKNLQFAYAGAFNDDMYAAITNRGDPSTFKTPNGTSAEGIPKFSERGGKTNKEDSCVVYNMVKRHFWVIPCSVDQRGFACEMPL